jgi:hypothetical protein
LNSKARPYLTSIELNIKLTSSDDTFWELVSYQGSLSPKVYKLNAISRFDVTGVIRRVPSGVYTPYIRIQILDPINRGEDIISLSRIAFGATVMNEKSDHPLSSTFSSVTSTLDSLTNIPSAFMVGTWLTFECPQITVVPHHSFSSLYVDVQLWAANHSNMWIRGLIIDTIGLNRVVAI